MDRRTYVDDLYNYATNGAGLPRYLAQLPVAGGSGYISGAGYQTASNEGTLRQRWENGANEAGLMAAAWGAALSPVMRGVGSPNPVTRTIAGAGIGAGGGAVVNMAEGGPMMDPTNIAAGTAIGAGGGLVGASLLRRAEPIIREVAEPGSTGADARAPIWRRAQEALPIPVSGDASLGIVYCQAPTAELRFHHASARFRHPDALLTGG